jgi:hypothetical protein
MGKMALEEVALHPSPHIPEGLFAIHSPDKGSRAFLGWWMDSQTENNSLLNFCICCYLLKVVK